MPNKAWPGIVFSHWGRLEVNHTSNTDYGPDDYSRPFVSADMDGDWRDAFKGHACFDPKKVRPDGMPVLGASAGTQQAPARAASACILYWLHSYPGWSCDHGLVDRHHRHSMKGLPDATHAVQHTNLVMITKKPGWSLTRRSLPV